jgi:outer membrane receptor protein involved in Fe transport
MGERTRRRWISTASAALTAMAGAGQVRADELRSGVAQPASTAPAAGAATDEVATVVVTGSRIRRADLETTTPITVVDTRAIETRGGLLPSDLLTSLPSVANLPENETRLGSSGARGDNANLNLRNMGATATLILINGRRMAINPFTAGLSQAVNINHLPTQGIDRIEVLRDGASSVYGSDAVGGVINYVLKRDVQGVEALVRHGHPEAGGGRSLQAALSFGTRFADGRGRLFGSIEGLWREETLLTQRDFSRTSLNVDRARPPFNALGGPFDGRSARGFWPTFRVGTSTANVFFRPVNGTPSLTTVAPTRAANPEFFLDLNPFGYAAPATTRGNLFATAEFDLTANVTAFAEFGFYKSSSTMQRQPLALNAPTSDQLMVMPIDNPYNPYGSRFFHPTGAPNADGTPRLVGAPRTVSFTQMTIRDLAPERIDTEADVHRIVGGLRGRVGDTSWDWEASIFHNKVTGTDDAFPDVRESLLQAAIARTDANAYNPFGHTFRVEGNAVVVDRRHINPKSVVDTFAAVYSRNAESAITSGDLRATGTLFTLLGVEVKAAAGVEHREEKLADVRPPFSGENPANSGLDPLNNDFLLHPPRPDVIGERQVTSAYAEFVAPLITRERGVPFVDSLELTASARHERYGDFGETTKPKVGVNWRPARWLMLRASYNEGFMAPSLAALYTSPRWSITAGAGDLDAYRNPFTNEGPYVKRTYFGGNPNLKPQESEGTTYGLVLDVPFVRGLSFTVDAWKIDRTNLLGQRSTAQIDESDAALLRAWTRAQIAAGVPANQIDVGAGATYKGDPDVERFALTPEDRAAFAAWNAANPNNPAAPAGRIFARFQPFVNLSTSEHRGVDFGLRYAPPRQAWGRIAITSDWSLLDRSLTTLAPANVAPTTNNGLYADGAAKWRGTTNVNWDMGPWNAGLGVYYVGKTHDSGATTTQAIYESLGKPSYIEPFFTAGRTLHRLVIDPVVTMNLSVGYQFGDAWPAWVGDTRVRFAVANLTDEAPPLASGAFGYDPGVSQTLLSGRTWSLELTRRF